MAAVCVCLQHACGQELRVGAAILRFIQTLPSGIPMGRKSNLEAKDDKTVASCRGRMRRSRDGMRSLEEKRGRRESVCVGGGCSGDRTKKYRGLRLE